MKEDFSILFSLLGVPKIGQFVGRKEELNKIKEAVRGDGSQCINAINLFMVALISNLRVTKIPWAPSATYVSSIKIKAR